ncbi:hypothetical protein OZD61_04170 [Wolbachia endosymbiont of Drosophila bocki]|nr:hypothetical protein [Wolbachia endosymbiont of Drosophila bocki]
MSFPSFLSYYEDFKQVLTYSNSKKKVSVQRSGKIKSRQGVLKT